MRKLVAAALTRLHIALCPTCRSGTQIQDEDEFYRWMARVSADNSER